MKLYAARHGQKGEKWFARSKILWHSRKTGAVWFDIKPICVYSVTGKNRVNESGEEIFGLLCYADIIEFSDQLNSEMEKVVLMEQLPENWTYPFIQPRLIEKYLQMVKQSYS